MLEVDELHASYGGAEVLHGVSLKVAQGEIVALLGANGAGKTTTFRCLSGLLRPASGSVRLDGVDVAGRRPDRLARAGVALVPEGRGVFRNLTVGENLRLGGYLLRRDPVAYRRVLDRVLDTFDVLRERRGQTAGTLSGGQQQMLAIGRALMSDPQILLVDEASLGLAPTIVKQLYGVFADLNREGMTLLVIEQSVGFALGFADRAYVMQKGTVVFEGRAAKLGDRDLLTAYLG